MRVAKAVKMVKQVAMTFLTPMQMQEVRVFDEGETVEISDTGTQTGGNYIPAQAAAQLIAGGFAEPVFKASVANQDIAVRSIILGKD